MDFISIDLLIKLYVPCFSKPRFKIRFGYKTQAALSHLLFANCGNSVNTPPNRDLKTEIKGIGEEFASFLVPSFIPGGPTFTPSREKLLIHPRGGCILLSL